MMPACASLRRLLLVAAAVSAPIAAEGARFSFRSIEFAPAEHRLPAARAYLHAHAGPGTPVSAAIAAVRRAEARCGRRHARDGAIMCRYSRVASDSAADLPIGDVTWTVRLYPSAAGTILRATVDRVVTGL